MGKIIGVITGCACGALLCVQLQAANLSASDRQFMDKAAQGGLAEVQLGHLA